jgi:hypothetical protein
MNDSRSPWARRVAQHADLTADLLAIAIVWVLTRVLHLAPAPWALGTLLCAVILLPQKRALGLVARGAWISGIAAAAAAVEYIMGAGETQRIAVVLLWTAVALMLRGVIRSVTVNEPLDKPTGWNPRSGTELDGIAGAVMVGAAGWLYSQVHSEFRVPIIGVMLVGVLWWLSLKAASYLGIRGFSKSSGALLAFGLFAALCVSLVSLAWGANVRAASGLVVLTGASWMAARLLCSDGAALEGLRLAIASGLGILLTWPLAHTIPMGGGDSVWYAETVADVLVQFRSGVFPVFVGQSEYQFNGSVFPVRVAPLLHHVAIVMDLLTLQSLPYGGALNAVLVGTGIAASVAAYVSFRVILPSNRWIAVLLAFLYLACPGVVALLYNGDLYMTWMTVPILPIVMVSVVQTFRAPSLMWAVLLGGSLGMLWWAHSPTALWVTTLVAILQVVRLLMQWRLRQTWVHGAIAGVLLAAIVAYPVVSVLVVTPETGGDNRSYAVADPVNIAHFVKEAFPGVWQPVSDIGRAPLADFQLGWTLAAGLVISFLCALFARKADLIGYTIIAGFLILLMTPIPDFNLALWSAIPAAIRNPTGNWAMSRIFPIAGTFSVFALGLAIAFLLRWKPILRILVASLLVVGAVWSQREAAKFRKGTKQNREIAATKPSPLLPENIVLSRYSYLVFSGVPPYFSHGYVDPYLEQRLYHLDAERLQVSNAAYASLENADGVRLVSKGPWAGAKTGPSSNWALSPEFSLAPGSRYVVDVDFANPAATGTLIVEGDRLLRVYGLPIHGEELAFGAGDKASGVLPLSNAGTQPSVVKARFVAQGEWENRDFSNFGSYRLFEYDRHKLPVAVSSWIPYTAQVTAPSEGWLETSRMYQRGYEARVNGAVAEVKASPRKLAMLRVPAGKSQVTLTYEAPLPLWTSYTASVVGFVAWIALSVYSARFQPRPTVVRA